MRIVVHCSISLVENFSFPLQLEKLRSMHVGVDSIIISVKSHLIVILSGGSVSQHCASLRWSTPKSSIKWRLVLFCKSSNVRSIQPISVFRGCRRFLNLRRGSSRRPSPHWSNVFRLLVKIAILGTSQKFSSSHISSMVAPIREKNRIIPSSLWFFSCLIQPIFRWLMSSLLNFYISPRCH